MEQVSKTPKKKRKRSYHKKKKDEPCKNPDCPNTLTGKQRDYCGTACSQKMYRARKAKEKREAAKRRKALAKKG